MGTSPCPATYPGRASGALGVVGVLCEPVDDHHAKRDDHHGYYRRRRDDKEPPHSGHYGEEVAHHQAKSSPTQEVYARVHRDQGDYRVEQDRKSTRLNSSHANISYAV